MKNKICFKAFDILLDLQENIPITKIARNLKITYSYCFKTIKKFEYNKLVMINRIDGRSNSISFLDKGIQLKEEFEGINNILGGNYEKQQI